MTSGSFAADRVAIGWHGKLPTVGDFVTRRLSASFVSHWDIWISRSLTELRDHSGNLWLEDYLTSPTWRFLLTPGFLPTPLSTETWVGVVMPSVDRVGRYYPLTLASPLVAVPETPDRRAALWAWLQMLEDIAIDALEGDWSIDTLETGLVNLGLPPNPKGNAVDALVGLDRSRLLGETIVSHNMEAFFAASSVESHSPEKHGRCVWYCSAAASDPRIFISRSLGDSIVRLWCADLDRKVTGN